MTKKFHLRMKMLHFSLVTCRYTLLQWSKLPSCTTPPRTEPCCSVVAVHHGMYSGTELLWEMIVQSQRNSEKYFWVKNPQFFRKLTSVCIWIFLYSLIGVNIYIVSEHVFANHFFSFKTITRSTIHKGQRVCGKASRTLARYSTEMLQTSPPR